MIKVKTVALSGGAIATELLVPGTLTVAKEDGSDRLTLAEVGTTPTRTDKVSVASKTVGCKEVWEENLSVPELSMSCETREESNPVTLAMLDCGACSKTFNCDAVVLLSTTSILG